MDPFLARLPDDLRSKVISVVNVVPESLQIFEEIYKQAVADAPDLHRKVRKLENGESMLDLGIPDETQVIFTLSDVSVLSPLRKKLDVILHLSPKDRKPMLSLLRDGKQEIAVNDLNKNISMAMFLPVAEKQNNLYIFISYTESLGHKYTEPILITLNKDALLTQFKQSGIFNSEVEDFTKCIEYMRKQAILAGFRIADPFFTNNQETGQNPSFHVECHRGTKEGTLYFLPDHIIFGFKKPILIFNSSEIESITYSSITRLTFNVTLVTKKEEKFEFIMIDQNEYAKIDEYVKRKQVKDKSMSEELKAKSKSKAVQQGQQNEHSPSALEAATQQLENESIINNVPLHSEDDEEDDENFEAESDLSDGSDAESVIGGEEDDGDEDADGDGDDDTKAEDDDNQIEAGIIDADRITREDDFNAALGLEDIPIELDDDDLSGVEYG